jgi:hypothetical protein
MRTLAALALSFFLLTSVAFADTPKDSDPQPAKASQTGKAATKPAKKPAGPTNAAIAEQLEQLKQAMQSQQGQIELLKNELAKRDQQIVEARDAAAAANAKAAEAGAKASDAASAAADIKSSTTAANSTTQTAQTDLVSRVDKVSKDVDAAKKESSEKIKALSALKFSGDLRLRYEPFFGGGPANGAALADRHRERFRLRFNATTKIADDFTVGLSLASGDFGDPISTNSTETGFFTRKPIAIDKAFATYNPHKFKPLSITAGKYGYTWYRTEMTFDNDLNPEGVSETLGWDWKDKFLSHVAFVGFQTPTFEVSGGPDSYVIGEQLQTGWRLGSRIKLLADAAYYDYGHPDPIAQNQGGGNGAATQGTTTPGGGNFGFSGNSLSNNFGVINGKRVFASKFGIFDSILRADIDTGHARLPIYFLMNYAVNTRACANLQAFVDAEVTAPTCDKHQRHAYWAEAQFGQTKNKNDFRFGYTFTRIERDAVVSAFNFSDIRNPTNVAQHRLEAFYQAYKNVTLGFTGFIGRQLVTAQSPTEERYLKRFQFDTIFTF